MGCCREGGGDFMKGVWTQEEDRKLVDWISSNGAKMWRDIPRQAGLDRCGDSCRLRWQCYLRPDINRGRFTDVDDAIIFRLHSQLGNKWSAIARELPGRTGYQVRDYWNMHLSKRPQPLLSGGTSTTATVSPYPCRPSSSTTALDDGLDLLELEDIEFDPNDECWKQWIEHM